MPPLLSLAMIVRDAERTLGASLASIRPWVDELVVVDTGSEDGTQRIIEQAGARLFHYQWCDNFAAARNCSLEHARGEWIFWMDSDDTVSEANGRKLHDLVRRNIDEFTLGFVLQVHCPPADPAMEQATVVDHIKVFRNRPDLRFEGRIHEQILPAIRQAAGRVEWTDIFVDHSLHDHSPAGQARKFARDLRLLNLDVAERPDHSFVWFNLGMTLGNAGRHDEASAALRRCLELAHPGESHVRKAYALLASSLARLNRPQEVAAVVQQGLRLFPEDAELLFRWAGCAQEAGAWGEAERIYRQLLSGKRLPHFASVDQGIFGFRSRHNLAAVCLRQGRLQEAETLWRQVLEEVPRFMPAADGLADVLLWQGRLAETGQLADRLVQEPATNVKGHLVRARYQQAMGRCDQAQRTLRDLVANQPDSAAALDAWCQVLVAGGQFAAAVEPLRALTRLAPSGSAFHNLGNVLLQIGSVSEAIAALEQSLAIRPGADHTRELLAAARRRSTTPGSAGTGSARQ